MPLDIGLVGATRIAERAIVAPSARHGDVRLRAVAASDLDRARAFAARNDIPRVHHDYEALVTDPALDAVYVSLHNSAHHRWVVRAAAAGKHVVVEKPLCLSNDQLAEIVEVASSAGVQVVEAVPTEGHEWQATVRAMIADRRYGRLRCVRTEMCFAPPAAGSYRDRPELGGGSSWTRRAIGSRLSSRRWVWRGRRGMDRSTPADRTAPTGRSGPVSTGPTAPTPS